MAVNKFWMLWVPGLQLGPSQYNSKAEASALAEQMVREKNYCNVYVLECVERVGTPISVVHETPVVAP